MTDEKLAGLLQVLRERGETITAAESCTGGLVAGRLTDIPGCSDVFRQGYVTYCDRAKHQLLGVREDTLERFTAVSARTAREMAIGAAAAAQAEAALSVTGYAGGPGSENDPDNGLVYIGVFYQGQTNVSENRFTGSRRQVREAAVEKALTMLEEALSSIGTAAVH